MARTRRSPVKTELLKKSREAALNAVQSFNNPLTTFKTETFIVLMVIAWTYLLHAYYHSKKIEYKHYEMDSKRRKFKRDSEGRYRYWELKQCLKEVACPLDDPTKKNLLFLIGLRNEIEHHESTGVDESLSSRYLACCLNYERFICELFGERHSLGTAAAFTLQFRDLTAVNVKEESAVRLPSQVAKFIQEFEADLSDEEFQSTHYQCRLLFRRVAANREGQADAIIDFVRYDSEVVKEGVEEQQQVVFKDRERNKYRPTTIVKMMNSEGYPRFTIRNHTNLWQKLKAKTPGKGFGKEIEKQWYWYDSWLEEVRQHCLSSGDKYRQA